MEFVVKEGQEETPKDEKVLQIVNTVVTVTGETTIETLKETLVRHKELRDQYIQSVADIEQQIVDANKAV